MMESEILKFICANQGAVDTEYLVSNLGCSVSDIISKGDKFASCCPFGQPKVVARTRLRLCRAEGCQGSCRGLHVCKGFLLSGSCQFTQTRKGCSFSHDLNSDHNKRILKEHELDSLNRRELCTLLLQSDNRLLPPICHDYNNGHGKFGRCLDGYGCKRLHICERYLIQDCRCNKNHDFCSLQPLKVLQDVPEDLIHSLKSIYANLQALRYHDNKGHRSNRHLRGKGENRGHRGKHDLRLQLERTSSASDILSATDLHSDEETNEGTSASAATGHTDAANSQNQTQRRAPNKNSMAARGRGGNHSSRGNRGYKGIQERAHSVNDLRTAFNVLELMDFSH